MKPICRIAVAVVILVLMSIADIPYLSENLVPEAQAMRGRGAAFVVGAAVGSAGSAPAPAAAAQLQLHKSLSCNPQPRLQPQRPRPRHRRRLSSQPPPPGNRCRRGQSFPLFLQDVIHPVGRGESLLLRRKLLPGQVPGKQPGVRDDKAEMTASRTDWAGPGRG